MKPHDLLISKKPLSSFTPEEYHKHVTDMYQERVKSGGSKAPVPGLSLSRTKSGKLSVRMNKKQRAFAYVLHSEIDFLAAHYGFERNEILEAFSSRSFIITDSRLNAEKVYEENLKR